jgi:hypothetical protein
MFNTNTFFGTDGILTLGDVDFEAFNADTFGEDAFESYLPEGAVGRLTNVTLSATTEVKAFHELGSHAVKDLRAGNVNISGTVERAFINGALLKLMLGQYAETEEQAPAFKMPNFNMTLILDNLQPSGDAGNSTLTVHGVIFDTWNFRVPEDDFVLEKLTFKARRISIKDEEVPT